jgi:hypothetical protein
MSIRRKTKLFKTLDKLMLWNNNAIRTQSGGYITNIVPGDPSVSWFFQGNLDSSPGGYEMFLFGSPAEAPYEDGYIFDASRNTISPGLINLTGAFPSNLRSPNASIITWDDNYTPGSTDPLTSKWSLSIFSMATTLDYNVMHTFNLDSESPTAPLMDLSVSDSGKNIILDYGSGDSSIGYIANLNLNTWHHYVIRVDHDAGFHELFVDNVYIGKTFADYTVTTPTYTGGGDYSLPQPRFRSLQKLDNTYLYNRIITDEEVSQLFNNGYGI